MRVIEQLHIADFISQTEQELFAVAGHAGHRNNLNGHAGSVAIVHAALDHAEGALAQHVGEIDDVAVDHLVLSASHLAASTARRGCEGLHQNVLQS